MKHSSRIKRAIPPMARRPGNRSTGLLAALALCGSGLAAAADPGPIRQVSAGSFHSCVVTEGREAWCWGPNSSGGVGDGTSVRPRYTPVRVRTTTPGLESDNVARIKANGGSSCAVTTSGQVFCWGANAWGQLGRGRWFYWGLPGPVVPTHRGFRDDNVVALDSRGSGTATPCAVTNAGQAFCWGLNSDGNAGIGNTRRRVLRPRPVNTDATGLSRRNVAQITSGGSHGCALNMAGRAFCWGANDRGQLGNGTTESSTVPVRVDASAPGLRGAQIAAIGAGSGFTCALTQAGQVACWGRNDLGQLGDGTTTDSAVPVVVGAGRLPFRRGQIAEISVGVAHACALTVSGRAWCWGSNAHGRLGIGASGEYRNSPESVDTSTVGFGPRNIAAISAGGSHSCAVNRAGALFCWGSNFWGRIAAPPEVSEVWVPRRVQFPSD